MNKITLLLVLILSVLSFNVFAALQIDSVTQSPNPIIFPDSNVVSVSVAVVVSNTGETINSVNVKGGPPSSAAALTLPFDSQTTLSNVVNTSTQTATLTLNVPRNTPQGVYAFSVTVEDVSGAVSLVKRDFSVVVNPSPDVDFKINDQDLGSNAIVLTGERGDTTEVQLKLKNTGNVDLTNIALSHGFTSDDLKDSDDNPITLTISPTTISTLAKGAETTVTLRANIDSSYEIDTLSNELILTSSSFSGGRFTHPLKIEVRPLACLSGSSSNELDLEVVEPADDEEFEPGEDLHLRIDVENKGSNDKDVKVEVGLYNLDNSRKVQGFSSTKNINDDSEKTYTFEFSLNTEDIDSDDDYAIFIKAYDRDEEEDTCLQETFDVELTVPEHKVLMESLNLNPTTVTCGNTVTGTVLLTNVGENNERVVLTATNPDLGLSYTSPDLFLTSDDDSDSSVYHTFSLITSANAKAGSYPVAVTARYSGETTEDIRTVAIQCGGTTSQTGGSGTTTGGAGTQVPVGSGTSFVDQTQGETDEKSIFEQFNTGSYKIPTSVWILIDIALIVIILAALVAIFKR